MGVSISSPTRYENELISKLSIVLFLKCINSSKTLTSIYLILFVGYIFYYVIPSLVIVYN